MSESAVYGRRGLSAFRPAPRLPLRVGEALALQRQDVTFKDGGRPHRDAQRGKQQDVPIGPSMTRVIHEVVKGLPHHGPLWRKPNGQPVKNFRMAWEGACKRAGVTDLWVHDLRRTFGTKALESGVDLVTVRDVLGHTNLRTTERYLWPEAKRQREASERVSAWIDRAVNGPQVVEATPADSEQLLEREA